MLYSIWVISLPIENYQFEILVVERFQSHCMIHAPYKYGIVQFGPKTDLTYASNGI